MIIADATPDTLRRTVDERSKYSYQTLTYSVARRDKGEPLVAAETLVSAGFALEPFWETPGDVEGECYASYIAEHPDFALAVREGTFHCLVRASRALPADWQLVIRAGFRPYEVQLAVLAAFMDESKARHPDWSEAQHLAQARTFVADPRVVCPPHVTGGAVDVDVRSRETGMLIDMGCPPNTDSEISFLHSDLVTSEQYDNRMTLLRAMLTAGFAPNPHEWWHYQYGETYWAAFYGHKATLYDLIKIA